LVELVRPYLHEEGLEFADGQREVVAAAIQANLVVLEDAPHFAKVFADDLVLTASVYLSALDEPAVGVVLGTTRERCEALADEYPGLDDARALLKGVAGTCAAQGIKGKSIYRPLRVALTGLDQGPELFYLIAGLGRSRILARLTDALAYFAEKDA
jgi:glutamyl/glutaminyl-tRNA synthetase